MLSMVVDRLTVLCRYSPVRLSSQLKHSPQHVKCRPQSARMARRLQCIEVIEHQSCIASVELVFQGCVNTTTLRRKQMKYKVIVALMLMAPVALLAASKDSANVTF